MKETTRMTVQEAFNLVLEVATKIHKEMLDDAFSFPGYEGDRDAFSSLLNEVGAITKASCPVGPVPHDVESMFNAWWEIQCLQGEDKLDADWYCYL